ncbi:MAG: flagellar protein FlgN [Deltaproteobacteria bacterium]|jgi:flagellar biosynthesis/type III secretory pathway chaperone|nr:flagellar protein FlgN [Deltaproteobacteria bacterium]
MDFTVIKNLADLLDIHLERYQSLIDFLDHEKKCLLSLDLEGLLVTSQQKEQLGRNIIKSIEELTISLSETALMLGMDTDPLPTLAEVAAHCPRPYDNRINDGAITLCRLKNIIVRENEANRHFIEQSLNLVNDSLNILTGADRFQVEGYRKDGTKDKSVKKSQPTKISKEV